MFSWPPKKSPPKQPWQPRSGDLAVALYDSTVNNDCIPAGGVVLIVHCEGKWCYIFKEGCDELQPVWSWILTSRFRLMGPR